MKIILNGSEKEFSANITIKQLLDSLGFNGKPVVIEHNDVAIFPRDYDNISLNEHDKIEIIHIAAGG